MSFFLRGSVFEGNATPHDCYFFLIFDFLPKPGIAIFIYPAGISNNESDTLPCLLFFHTVVHLLTPL